MQGAALQIAFDLATKAGRPLPPQVSATQTRDAAGGPLLHRMTVFNASDRRRYEQELLRAKNAAEQATADLQQSQATLATERDRLRQILDILPVAVLIVGADGQTVLTNAAARALLGRDVTAAFLIEATEAPGLALELLGPDGTPYPRTERPLRRSLQAGEAVAAAGAPLRPAGGGPHGPPPLPSGGPPHQRGRVHGGGSGPP